MQRMTKGKRIPQIKFCRVRIGKAPAINRSLWTVITLFTRGVTGLFNPVIVAMQVNRNEKTIKG